MTVGKPCMAPHAGHGRIVTIPFIGITETVENKQNNK